MCVDKLTYKFTSNPSSLRLNAFFEVCCMSVCSSSCTLLTACTSCSNLITFPSRLTNLCVCTCTPLAMKSNMGNSRCALACGLRSIVHLPLCCGFTLCCDSENHMYKTPVFFHQSIATSLHVVLEIDLLIRYLRESAEVDRNWYQFPA